MNSYIIRIEALKGNSYPMALEECSAAGAPEAVAQGSLPRNLKPAGFQNPRSADQMITTFAGAGKPTPQLEEIGEQLCALLDEGAIGQALAALPGSYRIILDIRDENLGRLPWELLCRHKLRLFADTAEERLFLRGRIDDTTCTCEHRWPLRLLIVIGAAPADGNGADAIDGEAEVDRIRDALHRWEPDIDDRVLRQPTRTQLRRELSRWRPDILHFIGHGYATEDSATKKTSSYLQLWSRNERNQKVKKDRWTPDLIRNDLAKGLRLAVINACLTGAKPGQGMWSVKQAFLEAGVPAVIAMQTEVAGDDCGTFAEELYRALAEKKSLDYAVAKARGGVHGAHGGTGLDRREWAAPCLEVRQLPEAVLCLGHRIDDKRRARFANAFPGIRMHVNRRRERSLTWENIEGKGKNVVVIHGQPEVGKTTFAKWILRRCALRGCQIRYVNLGDELTFLDVLRRIRLGHRDVNAPRIERRLEPNAFAEFDAKQTELLGGVTEPLSEVARQRDKAEDLCASFCRGLVKVAETERLTLVLDQLDDLGADEFTNYLRPYLYAWCRDRQGGPGIRLLVVVNDTTFRSFDMDQFESEFISVKLEAFPERRWDELAAEYLRRLLLKDCSPEDVRAHLAEATIYIQGTRKVHIKGGTWKPWMLPHFLSPRE